MKHSGKRKTYALKGKGGVVTQMELKVSYPYTRLDAVQATRGEFEKEAKMAMAAKLFEMKRLTSAVAASLAGMDRVSFLLNLHRYGVAMIDLEEEELISDMENA